jgi:hypothetical protein
MLGLWDAFHLNCAGLSIYSTEGKNWGKGFVSQFGADKSGSD